MGFGSIIGGVVGFAVGGPVGAAAGAAFGGSKAAESAAHDIGKAAEKVGEITEEFIEGFGTILYKGGVAIVDAIGDLGKSAFNVLHGTIAFRSLRYSEYEVLKPVFGDSVPWGRIVVSSLIGMENRPLCLPGSMITSLGWALPGVFPLLGVYSLMRGLSDKYILCLGMDGYNHSLNMPFDNRRGGQTLVHEVTHVWQGHNQAWSWGYVIESVFNQCKCHLTGGDPYEAVPGRQWQDYNCEQQGRLVEEWYIAAGASRRRSRVQIANPVSKALLDTYMDYNVRPGRPHQVVTLPTTMGIGTVTSAMTSMTSNANPAGTLKVGGALNTGGAAAVKPGAALSMQASAIHGQQAALLQQAERLRMEALITRNTGNLGRARALEAQAQEFQQAAARLGQPQLRQSATAPVNVSPFRK